MTSQAEKDALLERINRMMSTGGSLLSNGSAARKLAEAITVGNPPDEPPIDPPDEPTEPEEPPTGDGAYLNADFYGQWANAGALADPGSFPISCWNSAAGYTVDPAWQVGDFPAALRHFGINLLYAYDGGHTMTTAHADRLVAEGLSVIAGTTAHRQWFTSRPAYASRLVGYIPGEEYDMNWPRESNYPAIVQQQADAYRAADPSRPVIVNWGKCMAGWGAGYHPAPGSTYAKDMAAYQAATDGTCADWYGWTDPWASAPRGAYVYGMTVDSQRRAAGPDVPAWFFVEATRPWAAGQNGTTASNVITPAQMESAVWQGIVHGGGGVCWFLQDMFAGGWSGPLGNRAQYEQQGNRMRAINQRLAALAPVLNTRPLGTLDATTGRVRPDELVRVTGNTAPVDVMVKRHAGETFLFVQAGGSPSVPLSARTTATFEFLSGTGSWQVDGENRTVPASFADTFAPYQFRLYRRS